MSTSSTLHPLVVGKTGAEDKVNKIVFVVKAYGWQDIELHFFLNFGARCSWVIGSIFCLLCSWWKIPVSSLNRMLGVPHCRWVLFVEHRNLSTVVWMERRFLSFQPLSKLLYWQMAENIKARLFAHFVELVLGKTFCPYSKEMWFCHSGCPVIVIELYWLLIVKCLIYD